MKIEGNREVPESDIRRRIPPRRGDRLPDGAAEQAAAEVTRRYRELGFYGAEAVAALVPAGNAPSDGGAVDLVVTVREGRRAVIGGVEVRGARAIDSGRAVGAIGLREGDLLLPERLGEGLAALVSLYDRSGHPFARASVAGIAPTAEGRLEVAVAVEEGDGVVIGELRVEGNGGTSPAVVLRESRMELPGGYDPGRISRYARRLRRLGIFSRVEEPGLYRAGDGGYGLLIRVAEGRSGTFDGILGYAPAGPADPGGSLTGRVSVSFRNLFGTGRRMEAGWSRIGRSTQEIRLAYEEPWAFGFPLNLGGGFSQRQQDSSFVDRRVLLSAEFLASASLSLAAVGEIKTVIPSAGAGGAGVPGSSALTGGVAVRYDTRDDPAIPRTGVLYRSEVRSGSRRPSAGSPGGTAGSRATLRHLSLDLDLFVPLAADQVLLLGVRARDLAAGTPEPGDLYRLGGATTLRGFREDRFSGTRLAWGTAEYRLIAAERSFAYAFLDPGYVATPSAGAELFTWGYGLGMRVETALGLLGVSFALGKGDPVSETKLHVGLMNDF